MKRHILLITGCLLALVLSACGSGGSVTAEDLRNTSFALEKVNGKAFITGLEGFPAPMLNFSDDLRVSGKVCNGFFGPARLDGVQLQVATLGSTRMACPNEALTTAETLLFHLLRDGAQVSLDNGALELVQGADSMTFKAIP